MQQKSFTRALPSILAAIAFLATSLFAQLSTGKIEGTVRDKDSGKPLLGVQVTIEGTRLGNVTNADGYYFVLNIPPGSRNITFMYTGYQTTTITNTLILAGQTTTVNGTLSSTVVELKGITVQGEAEVLLPRDQTVSKQRLTTEQLKETPVTRLEDMMILQAGVQVGGRDAEARGLRIRGGRLGEEGMVVDGVMLRNYTANPFASGQGWIFEQEIGSQAEDTTPLEFSNDAVEEVDILTGGFQAEYGNAQSGIINIVTKEGGAQYKGSAKFTTDEQNPRTADYGYNQLTGTVGGPVPMVKNMYFQLSAEIQGTADRNPTHADEGFRGINQAFVDRLNEGVRNDPVLGQRHPAYTLAMLQAGRESYAALSGQSPALFMPENPVRLPGNWQDRSMYTGKITYSPIKGLKLILSENWSRNQHSYPQGYSGEGNYFRSGIIDRNDPSYPLLYGDLFDQSPWWAETPAVTGFPKHESADIIRIWQSNGRRSKVTNSMLGFDWDFLRQANRSGSVQFRYALFRSNEISAGSLQTNWERSTIMSWSPHDIRFEIETWPNRENLWSAELQKQYLPDGATGWKNGVRFEQPFNVGTDALYYLHYNYLRESQENFKADVDFQLDRWNRAKLGFLFMPFKIHRFSANYYAEKRDPRNEFRYRPKMYSGYIQNRTDLGDFVFDYGLRYDGFQHNYNWGLSALDFWGENVHPRTLYEWSPRFDVAFPVTDKAQLRFSYGVFTQLPSMNDMFAGSSGGSPFYNPGGLEFSRTDAFESGLSYLLSSDMVMDVVAYYRDVDGNVAQKAYFRDYYAWHREYRVRQWAQGLVNRDNGNIKGVDVTLRKRFSQNFSFNLQYTMQFSRTTGSAYNSGQFLGNYDAASNELFVPPDELRPIDGDQTHKLSYQFNYLFPEDFKSGTMVNTILRNVRAYAVFVIQSGTPLTQRYNWDGSTIGGYTGSEDPALTGQYNGYNFFRGRWLTDLTFRGSKQFNIGGSRRISFFAEVFNALNRKNKAAYPTGYRLEGYSHLTGGVDMKWADQVSSIENRVRFNADFNKDGILSIEEAAMGGIAASMIDDTMDKRVWGTARQIRTGLEFTF